RPTRATVLPRGISKLTCSRAGFSEPTYVKLTSFTDTSPFARSTVYLPSFFSGSKSIRANKVWLAAIPRWN
ncbi:hypothetical protein D039_0646B, partial [Vibrio parahaemolyticus EKP-028]